MSSSITILMSQEKQCKGSIRYAAHDPDAVVGSIYLSRSYASPMPPQIQITLSPLPSHLPSPTSPEMDLPQAKETR